jgi:hypothetical protein
MRRLFCLPYALVALAGCSVTPIAPLVSIVPEGAATLDTLGLRFVSHPEASNLGDTVSYQISWYVDGTEVPELASKMEVPFERTAKDEQWRVTVTPMDSRELHGRSGEATATIQNTAPSSLVELQPLEPQPTQDIEVFAKGDDIDGDDVTFRYEWSEDGVKSEHTGRVLPESMTKRGDMWKVLAYPDDGENEGEPAEANVTVENALPLTTVVTLTPREAFERTELVVETEGTDADGDLLTWTFTWYVDGEALTGVDGSVLTGAHFDKGAKIRVEAAPNDGFVDGDPGFSDYAYIFNTPPTATAAALTPTEAYATTTMACDGVGFTDEDNDMEGWRYAWQVNGAEDPLRKESIQGGFSQGQSVSCTVRPFDGEEEGAEAYRSSTITIL